MPPSAGPASRPWSRSARAIRERFGGIGEGVARGLRLRHDHGSNYLADDFQQEVAFFGIESSPSFVREPEGNGVAERFIRTLKENLLWVRSFATIEELRLALLAFKRTYNEQWMLEKYDYRKAPPRCDATSSGWTRQRRSEYRQTTVQEPWGSTAVGSFVSTKSVADGLIEKLREAGDPLGELWLRQRERRRRAG